MTSADLDTYKKALDLLVTDDIYDGGMVRQTTPARLAHAISTAVRSDMQTWCADGDESDVCSEWIGTSVFKLIDDLSLEQATSDAPKILDAVKANIAARKPAQSEPVAPAVPMATDRQQAYVYQLTGDPSIIARLPTLTKRDASILIDEILG